MPELKAHMELQVSRIFAYPRSKLLYVLPFRIIQTQEKNIVKWKLGLCLEKKHEKYIPHFASDI